MRQKQYKAIASVIRREYIAYCGSSGAPGACAYVVEDMAESLANHFESEDALFDKMEFLEICFKGE